MAAVAPHSDQTADLLQKLSLDPQTKTLEVPEPTKKFTPVNSDVLLNGLNKPFERSTTPFQQDIMDPTMGYLPNGYSPSAYYCEGYDGSVGNMDDYSRYVYPDGVEGVYGDNASLMYQHGYSYAPYGSYPPPGSPVPSMTHDSQLYGPQHYQYPTPYFQPSTTTGQSYPPNQMNAPKAGVSTPIAADQVPLPVEPQANMGSANGTTKSRRPSYQNSSLSSNASHGRGTTATGITSLGYQDPRFSFDGIQSPNPWLDVSLYYDGKPKHAPVSHGGNFPTGRNQNIRPFSHLMGLQHPRSTAGVGQVGFMNTMYPTNKMYGQYANSFRSGTGFGFNSYNTRINGRGGLLAVDSKYKPRGRGNGSFSNENVYGLNELNRGPRTKTLKDQKSDNNDDNLPLIPDKEQYNKNNFPETYSDAKFFIIKSYSEDDVHKSIKYGVWASTPNGNKKLDSAYQEAQTAGGHPVFLLFSVNASGQFVGVAEMVGRVDFDKSLEYWQQDKWTGYFPVKWHILKDVPNNLLKHITLENNENKPVTNSRDTQEVKFEQGIQILKIFKDHSSKTCILDDFQFYEGRQKIMQQHKSKQQQFNKQQVGNTKPVDAVISDDKDRDGLIVANGVQKSLEIASDSLIEDPITATTETVETTSEAVFPSLEENGQVATAEDASKDAKKPVLMLEKRVVSNGVANGF